jgi:hypothetical protein
MIDVKILEAAKQEVADTLFLKSEKLKSLPLQEQYEFDIDITKLPPHQTNAKRGSKYYYEGLKIMGLEPILNEKRGAVYVFHLPENPDRDEYVKSIINCKKSIGRNAPSVENIMKRDFKVLYVGSFKSHFYTRFIQHLGYGTKNTAALQLIHWAPNLFSKIKMTYLPVDYSDLALHTLMEIAMCKTMVPMIGRMERDKIK